MAKLFLLFLLLISSLPAFAQEQKTEASQYVIGKVVEIISEKTIVDEAFGRRDKNIRFKVRFLSGQKKGSVHTLEQSYSEQTPTSVMPRKGKKFVFLQEIAPDRTVSYVLLDAYRMGDVLWGAVLCICMLLLIGRWHGLKILLSVIAAIGLFFLLKILSIPLLLTSLLVLLVVGGLGSLLLTGVTPKWMIALIAMIVSSGLILLLLWLATFMMTLDINSLFQSSVLLGMLGGMIYICLTTVSAVYENYKSDPTLSARDLFQDGMHMGRRSIEIVIMIVTFIYLGQILPTLYYSEQLPNLMQLEPVLNDLAILLFTVMGFILTLPLTAFISIRILYRRRV